jgi:hypothetical protein
MGKIKKSSANHYSGSRTASTCRRSLAASARAAPDPGIFDGVHSIPGDLVDLLTRNGTFAFLQDLQETGHLWDLRNWTGITKIRLRRRTAGDIQLCDEFELLRQTGDCFYDILGADPMFRTYAGQWHRLDAVLAMVAHASSLWLQEPRWLSQPQLQISEPPTSHCRLLPELCVHRHSPRHRHHARAHNGVSAVRASDHRTPLMLLHSQTWFHSTVFHCTCALRRCPLIDCVLQLYPRRVASHACVFPPKYSVLVSRALANPECIHTPVHAVQSHRSDVCLLSHIPHATACSRSLPVGRLTMPVKASSTLWTHRRVDSAS